MIDALLDAACQRNLTQQEAETISSYAKTTGKAEPILVRLMLLGTFVGRTNLHTLLQSHFPMKKQFSRTRSIRPKAWTPSEGPTDRRLVMTAHALQRYTQRHCKGEDSTTVKSWLDKEVSTARPLREKTVKGDELWVSDSGVRFVVRRDNKWAVCVTILPNRTNYE